MYILNTLVDQINQNDPQRKNLDCRFKNLNGEQVRNLHACVRHLDGISPLETKFAECICRTTIHVTQKMRVRVVPENLVNDDPGGDALILIFTSHCFEIK